MIFSKGNVKGKIYITGKNFTAAQKEYKDKIRHFVEESGYIVSEDIKDAEKVIALLDGMSVDCHTSWDVGVAFGLERPILGIRTDFRTLGNFQDQKIDLMVESACTRFLFIPSCDFEEIRREVSRFVSEVTACTREAVEVVSPSSEKKIIYVAGALFTGEERDYVERVGRIIDSAGARSYLPHRDSKDNAGADTSRARMMRIFNDDWRSAARADAVVALLDGCPLDCGTVWELGLVSTLRKPVFGIRIDERVSNDTIIPERVCSSGFIHSTSGFAPIEEAVHRFIVAEALNHTPVRCCS